MLEIIGSKSGHSYLFTFTIYHLLALHTLGLLLSFYRPSLYRLRTRLYKVSDRQYLLLFIILVTLFALPLPLTSRRDCRHFIQPYDLVRGRAEHLVDVGQRMRASM